MFLEVAQLDGRIEKVKNQAQAAFGQGNDTEMRKLFQLMQTLQSKRDAIAQNGYLTVEVETVEDINKLITYTKELGQDAPMDLTYILKKQIQHLENEKVRLRLQ